MGSMGKKDVPRATTFTPFGPVAHSVFTAGTGQVLELTLVRPTTVARWPPAPSPFTTAACQAQARGSGDAEGWAEGAGKAEDGSGMAVGCSLVPQPASAQAAAEIIKITDLCARTGNPPLVSVPGQKVAVERQVVFSSRRRMAW
jgi:hypothetical protein